MKVVDKNRGVILLEIWTQELRELHKNKAFNGKKVRNLERAIRTKQAELYEHKMVNSIWQNEK